MSKKNFKNINPAMAFISDVPEERDVQHKPNAQDTQHEPNVHIVSDAHTTQGKKRRKFPRINMAFSPENLEYLQIISRIEGKSITEYVNTLIRIDKSGRDDEIKKARSILFI